MEKKVGSVVYSKARDCWMYLYYEGPMRTSKKLPLAPGASRADALREAEKFRRTNEDRNVKVRTLVERYMASDEMPKREDSRRGYKSNINKWILPAWGDKWVLEVRDHPGRLKKWLNSLPMATMSRARIRAVMHSIFNFAMTEELIPFGVNPMTVAKVKGSTERRKAAWSLSKAEFWRWTRELEEPFRTIALVSLLCGLRISEALALKWSGIDWLNRELPIRKGMVHQRLDDVKSKRSRRKMHLVPEAVAALEAWRQTTAYREDTDWVFASPYQEGRLPYSYGTVREKYQEAAERAGIEIPEDAVFGTHLMRHSCRTHLKKGTKEADVQRDVLGHSSVTINQDDYGEVLEEEVKEAQEKLASFIFSKDVEQTDGADGGGE